MRVEISYIHKEDKIEKVLLAYSMRDRECMVLFTTDGVRCSMNGSMYNSGAIFEYSYLFSYHKDKLRDSGLLVWEGQLVVKRYIEKPDVVMEGYSDDQSGYISVGYEGDWRELTEEEWKAVKEFRNPFVVVEKQS